MCIQNTVWCALGPVLVHMMEPAYTIVQKFYSAGQNHQLQLECSSQEANALQSHLDIQNLESCNYALKPLSDVRIICGRRARDDGMDW